MQINKEIKIKGAGIAGLTSAIILAQRGFAVTVFEKSGAVGIRRHGDFQGLENWTDDENVLQYLARLGITTDFWLRPVSKITVFSPSNLRYDFEAEQPLLYMIKRGGTPGCLDLALRNHAVSLGIEVICNTKIKGRVHIDSSGAKKGVAFARGISFKTDASDMVIAIIDDRVAPKGYSYFIVFDGRATLVSAFFTPPFRDSKRYFHETLERYADLLNFKIFDPREFGRYIDFYLLGPGNHLVIGEAAGIQDYFFGFGMRLAIKSAELAADSLVGGDSYHKLYKREIQPFLRAGIVNRFLFERLGNAGYERQLKKIAVIGDIRKVMGNRYNFTKIHKLLYPFARFKYRNFFNNNLMREQK
ncbi:MAG: NAD(P)/FAD-dependent oxidoreductase [Actinomycetota bacterium]|nr:NAD(P)/FAD-dependent oxidoreductase [Actinomycetota bacterium]